MQRTLERLRAEFLEMPDLRLKLEQVQRLCGVDRATCQLVLESLVSAKFLWVSADGCYARVTDCSMSVPRPTKADLRVEPPMAKAS
jgi:hypothetical protein